MSTTHYELFQHTSIGIGLTDALDDMVRDGSIEKQLAIRIVAIFDQCFANIMAEQIKARMSMRGRLQDYRNVDDVWTLWCRDVKFKLDNQNLLLAERVKIIACLNKKAAS